MAVMPEIVVNVLIAGRCATCRHWDRADRESLELLDVRQCTAVPQLWDATEWVETDGFEMARKPVAAYAERLAFAKDGSDYRALLMTKAEFGCVQWEAMQS